MEHALLLWMHLLGVVVWVGGMFFAYFCLRPAAVEVLQPPQRLPLWSAVFARFLPLTAVAVALVLLAGLRMWWRVGPAQAPWGWHLMLALGLLMGAVFVLVWRVYYPRLRAHCAQQQWPQAAQALNHIRRWVAVNLVLSLLTITSAVLGRYAG